MKQGGTAHTFMNRFNEQSDIAKIAITGLMAALVMLCTSVFKIPTIATQGYVHLGDAMVFLSVVFLGRRNGVVAASMGSGLADLLGGYPYWVPWTLAIKALMALSFSLISGRRDPEARPLQMRDVLGLLVAGVIMVGGYYLSASIMYGSFASPLATVPWNIVQACSGIVVTSVVIAAMSGTSK